MIISCFNNLDQFDRLKGHGQHVQNAHHETGVLNTRCTQNAEMFQLDCRSQLRNQ